MQNIVYNNLLRKGLLFIYEYSVVPNKRVDKNVISAGVGGSRGRSPPMNCRCEGVKGSEAPMTCRSGVKIHTYTFIRYYIVVCSDKKKALLSGH